jgi:hypothetical protein
MNVRTHTASPRGAIRSLMEQVRAEYGEMPGLSVTLPQAQRLWGADQPTCEEVFGRLVAKGLLRRTAKGRFVRA